MKNILFVCRYNRFRSKVAESIFNKINKNSKIKVKSAGLIKGIPLAKETIKAAKGVGVIIKDPTKGLSSKVLAWQDTVIIVADDVPMQVFQGKEMKNKNLIIWYIPDIHHNDSEGIKKVIAMIEKKVGELVKSLGHVQSP